jgi:hypothetical protein
MTETLSLTPAGIADLLALPAPAVVRDAWEATWASPHAEDAHAAMRPHLLRSAGEPLAALGVNTVAAPTGDLYPWVWAVPNAERRPTRSELVAGIRLARWWLDDHAPGHVTTPQVWDDPSYTKLLRVVGFNDHGSGVWVWRS